MHGLRLAHLNRVIRFNWAGLCAVGAGVALLLNNAWAGQKFFPLYVVYAMIPAVCFLGGILTGLRGRQVATIDERASQVSADVHESVANDLDRHAWTSITCFTAGSAAAILGAPMYFLDGLNPATDMSGFGRLPEKIWMWLAANKDVAAVIVAIAVPVLQRFGENKDRRVREAALLVSQYQAVFFLLCDVENDLRKPALLANMPSGLIFVGAEGEDLLQRIRALEQRELDAAAVVALFRARSLITTARNSLRVANPQRPLAENHIATLSANADRAKLYKDDVHKRLVAAEFRLAAARLSLWSCPIGKPILLLRAKKAHSGVHVKEPSYPVAGAQAIHTPSAGQ